MSDIFMSYAREDETRVRPLVEALEAQGWSVFWDREIPAGETWRSFIGQALRDARVVIVTWSKSAVASHWVIEEADEAQRRGALVPVRLEEVELPMGFRSLQTADLSAWLTSGDAEEFERFVEDVRAALRRLPPRPTPPSAPAVHGPRPQRIGISRPALVLTTIVLAAALAAWAYVGRRSAGPHETSDRGPTPVATSGDPNTTPRPSSGSASTSGETTGAAVELSRLDAAPSRSTSFGLAIGDRVSDGVPAAGAGILSDRFEQDVYTFTAAPRQMIYVRVHQLSDPLRLGYVPWRLVDEDATVVFERYLSGGDPGVQTLVRGGRYTLTVGGKDPAVGLYQFQLFNVPQPRSWDITLGSSVKDGAPGEGAGVIESPGSKDIYTFTARPRQRVILKAKASDTITRGYLKWRLVDEDGSIVFDTLLVADPGVQMLVRGGRYTLTVGSDNDPSTGTYEIELVPQG